jgi:hypothetical protein
MEGVGSVKAVDLAVQTGGLSMSYDGMVVVDSIDLSVTLHSIFGFVGPYAPTSWSQPQGCSTILSASIGSWSTAPTRSVSPQEKPPHD